MTHLTPDEIEASAQGAPHGHLDSCAECRASVVSAKGRRALLAGLKPYTLSDMAFRRVEASVVEYAERPPTGWRTLLMIAVPAAVALAVVVTVVNLRDDTAPSLSTPFRPVSIARAKGSQPVFTAMLASADAQQQAAGAEWKKLVAGDQVQRNSALSGGALVLQPSDLNWVYSLKGSATTAEGASLTLGAGTLVADVAGAASDIAVARLHLSTTDAAFLVQRAAAEVLLEVSRGELLVTDESSQLKLVAPARVRWSDGMRLDAAQRLPPAGFTLPHRQVAPWAVATANAPDTLTGIDGVPLETEVQRLLASEGSHSLMLRHGDLIQAVKVDLKSSLSTTVAYDLPDELPGRGPEPDALKRLNQEIAQQTPRLAACYEKWLKATATSAGSLDLALRISAQGKVTEAHVEAPPAELPKGVRECLSLAGRRLSLSPVGVATDVVVPLVLKSHPPNGP